MSKETKRLYELAQKRLEERKKGLPRSFPVINSKNPSIIEKGVNFIKSATKHIVNGMKKVSQKEMNRRIDICKGCEFFTDGERPSCSKCGCYMNIKARWESEHCPIDKW
jgi:hypothetical protein